MDYCRIYLLFTTQLLPSRKLSSLRKSISRCISVFQLGLCQSRKGLTTVRILQQISRESCIIRITDENTLNLSCVLDSLVREPTCRDFFRVLARLLYVMCRPSALAKHMRSQMLPDSHQITSRHWSGTPTDFEYLDAKSRAYMLQAVVSLFADWPDYLIDVLRSTNRLHHLHHLLKYRSLPSWYESAVRIAATRNCRPKPSDREKFLHAAIQQGWIKAVQLAEETPNTGSFLRSRSA